MHLRTNFLHLTLQIHFNFTALYFFLKLLEVVSRGHFYSAVLFRIFFYLFDAFHLILIVFYQEKILENVNNELFILVVDFALIVG